MTTFLALTCLATVTATHDVPNPSGVRSIWGITVGIERYSGLDLPPRRFAREDAARVRDFLISDVGMHAPAEQVWLFTDRPDTLPNATLASAPNLRSAFQTIAEKASPNDLFFFFFRIAALPETEELRYLAVDATPTSLSRTTFLGSELNLLLEALPCHWTCGYLDITYETPAKTIGPSEIHTASLRANPFSGLIGSQRFVVSANDGRFAAPYDASKNSGIFAEVLLTGLQGAADSEGGGPDGWITLGEVWQYLKTEVPQRARLLVGNEANATPKLWGTTDFRDICLARNASIAPKIEGQVQQLHQLFQNGTISKSQRDEGERLLRMVPHTNSERALLQGYRDLLVGRVTPSEIDRLSQDALADRGIDPSIAKRFADAILEARDLIDLHYYRPAQGNAAVRAGIEALYRQVATTIPPAISESLNKIDESSTDDVLALLLKARMHLGKREDFSEKSARDVALAAMLESLDPHSRYIPKSELESDRRSVDGEFAGLGLQVTYSQTSRNLVVHSPLLGSPAYRAGIRAGDQIVAIDDSQVADMDEETALGRLRGKHGSTVRLNILHPDGKHSDRTVRYSDVKLETVVGLRRKPDHSWDFWLEPTERIAYVRITSFDYNTADDFRQEIGKLNREKQLAGLVLDLRFNRGGVRKAAIDVAGLFVQGEIVTIRTREGADVRSGRSFFRFNFPIAVLINGESASSSEIVAAAIADHHRGIVVGERTFGKGSSQEILPLTLAGGAMRLTTASLWRPNGKSLHKESANAQSWGVTPDPEYLVPVPREDAQRLLQSFRDQEMIRDRPPDLQFEVAEDPQLMRALEALISRQKPASKTGR